ncbi:MAG: hypothetical protein KF823_15650 [Xanthomonadales bacterium]|nr:hypothetical protein [Xanthomonadales bacterium]
MTPAVASLLLSIAATASQGAPSVEATRHGFEAQIRQAEALGRQLHVLERAERVATAAVRQVRGFRRDRAGLVTLATPAGEGVEVDFAARDEDGQWLIRYRASVGPDGRVHGRAERLQEPVPMPAERVRIIEVRQRVLGYAFQRCSNDVSAIVVPGSDEARGLVHGYLLAASEGNTFAVGGNFRMDVAADGSIRATRPFANSCLRLADDRRAVAVTLSHLLDPHPTEIHVLISLRAGKPLFVATAENRILWRVDGGSIEFVQPLSADGSGASR